MQRRRHLLSLALLAWAWSLCSEAEWRRTANWLEMVHHFSAIMPWSTALAYAWEHGDMCDRALAESDPEPGQREGSRLPETQVPAALVSISDRRPNLEPCCSWGRIPWVHDLPASLSERPPTPPPRA